jgi:DeoR/GlpR family transcriptional regulator of sugar metabolism
MNERQNKIIEALLENTSASVSDLSRRLLVSEVTIRSDLATLEKRGRVMRTRGGARLAGERVRQEYTFATRQQINAGLKNKIGKRASDLIDPFDAILLDSSTTAVAVAYALREKNDLKDITVVPTGLWTAIELLASPGINILLSGGYVRPTTGSITGLPANEFLKSFNFQKAFLGAGGLTLEKGASDSHLLEVELKRCIVNYAQEVIIVADGSKFGRQALASYAMPDQIDKIITDESAPDDMIDSFRNAGVEVLVAL